MRHYIDKDKSVWAYLQSIGVSFESVYHGGRIDNDNGHKWEHDIFTVRFVRGKSEIETSYRQGIGHRVSADLNGLGSEAAQVGAGAPKYLDTVFKGMETIKTYVKKPSPAAVLYCLLSDASLGAELFADFCADLGYDEDSRKALAIYEECQKTAAKLRMFTPGEREKLAELLEDY
jgi:hypothetical protein